MNRKREIAPVRPANPVQNASFLSKHLFLWLRDLFRLGLQRPIDSDDIYASLPQHRSHKLSADFEELWSSEKLERNKPSLFRVLHRIYTRKFFLIGFLVFFLDTITKVVQPHCLGGLVTYFSPDQHNLTIHDAYRYAGGLVGCSFLSVVTMQPLVFYMLQLGMCIRQTCCAMIYKKLLRLTKAVSIDGLNGQVINLMSNDVARFDQVLAYFHCLWKGPVELMLMAYFIYQEVQWYGLIGVGFLLCFLPIQTWIGRRAAIYRLRTAKRTDRRVRIMNEIIQAIHVIKMYTWEKSFARIVDEIRRKELHGIRGTLFIRGTLLSFNIISRVSIFVSLASYVYCGNVFTARKVFIVTSYFNFLYYSLLHYWPLGISTVSESLISIGRIEEFLQLPECKAQVLAARARQMRRNQNTPPIIDHELDSLLNKPAKPVAEQFGSRTIQPAVESGKSGVHLVAATARWLRDTSGSTVGIDNVSLAIEPAKLCVIVGTVGSGKSTLLQTILGELELDAGTIAINGTISYAPQEPWLFEGSIRQNIVFVEPFDPHRYQQVLRVCSLERDLELFEHGDATIVGERGASLSGGQRARVNLARAVYKKADIYLLDDPLSAVDTHVGKHIFEHCVRGYLQANICVLVTHQLQYLRDVEQTVLMSGGRVVAEDSFQNLKNSRQHSLLWSGVDGDDGGGSELELSEAAPLAPEIIRRTAKITTPDEQNAPKEAQLQGSAGLRVLVSYFAAVNSRCFVATVLLLFVVAQTCISAVDWLVSRWVSWEQQHTLDDTSPAIVHTRFQYIYTYAGIVAIVLYLVFQRSLAFFQLCLVASRRMHDQMFRGITRAWMSFFNANPSGRILNRFSTDIGSIDTILPVALMDVLTFVCELMAVFVLVSIANSWLLLPTVAMSAVCYALRHVYINTARSVKRIESLTRSPIFSHTNATLQGLSTIRSFKAESAVLAEFEAHQDLNTSSWYVFLATSRAFSMWLELTCCAYMSMVLLSFLMFADNTVGSALGLAMTQIFNLFTMCQWGMRQSAELENQLTSVERVTEYTDQTPEPALETPADQKPPPNWPTQGTIRFEALSMRYTPSGSYVLRDLSFHIADREKIGIVGRTGAGKSSIIQALFRLAQNEGRIIIDGLGTAELGLHDLRSKISIIPQDPVLFSGTMRSNLDPFAEASDAAIWGALRQVELGEVVQQLPGGLDGRMSDSGANLSMGQRQLVCLARAILRNNRLLILDEATANVDAETDKLIQTTIREKFADCTVLTIAHRLHTVMDSDRVLVMDAGRMAQLGHPWELLGQEGGIFRGLVEQTGATTSRFLWQLAEDNWQAKRGAREAGGGAAQTEADTDPET